jgi:hypothetical protein
VNLPILTFDFRCFNCGFPQRIPVPPEFDSPAYVMLMEKEHELLKKEMANMSSTLMELAHECLDAGVKPEVLRRADALKAMIDEWRRKLGDI